MNTSQIRNKIRLTVVSAIMVLGFFSFNIQSFLNNFNDTNSASRYTQIDYSAGYRSDGGSNGGGTGV